MNALDRLTDALVRRAARRWPADMADSLLREWRAELATLRARPHISPSKRIWRQVAFALSLACSPTTEPRTSLSHGWKRAGTALAGVARQLVLSLGVAVLAVFVASGMGDLANQLVTRNRYDVEPATWWYVTAHVGTDVLGLAIVGLVAVFTARRFGGAVGLGPPGGAPVIQRSILLVVPLALASYLVYLARHAGNGYGPTFELIRAQGAAAIGAWTIVMIVAVAAGRRMAAARRRTTAWVVTGLGALLATDVAAFLASVRAAGTLHIGRGSGLLWFPLSYLPDGFSGIGPLIPAGTTRIGNGSIGSDRAFPALNLLLPICAEVAVPLLMVSAFVVVFGLRDRPQPATAADSAAPSAMPDQDAVERWLPRGPRSFALTTTVVGLGVWAGATTLGVAQPDNIFRSDALQVQFAAILLVVLGVVMCSVGRGRVTLPTIGLAATLLAIDAVAVRNGWAGAGAATGLAAGGVMAAAAAWWVSGRIPGPATSPASGRGVLGSVAVVGALAAPTTISVSDIFANHAWIPNAFGATGPTSPPALLSLASVGVAALLAATAFVAAWASRRTTMPRPAVGMFLAIYAAVFLVGVVDGDAVRRALYWPFPSFFVQPALVVVLVAFVRWRPGHGVRRSLGWCAVGVVAVVATVASQQPMLDLGAVLSGPFARVAARGAPGGLDPVDAGLLWAQVAVGLALAFGLAPRIAPP
ncbi:MAG TPA: hypothetical protein VE132_16255, partial [Micromonosporaceae bacterium]|nr:hypothetical protein [Micromonosporaceae bacterium]